MDSPDRIGRKGRLVVVAQTGASAGKPSERVRIPPTTPPQSSGIERKLMRRIHLFSKNAHMGRDSKDAPMYLGTWDGESACGEVQWMNKDTQGGHQEPWKQ